MPRASKNKGRRALDVGTRLLLPAPAVAEQPQSRAIQLPGRPGRAAEAQTPEPVEQVPACEVSVGGWMDTIISRREAEDQRLADETCQAESGEPEHDEPESEDAVTDPVGEARLTLERTPQVLRAMLAGLPEEAVVRPYGPRTFSPYNVLGHLIIGEQTDWIPRARLILEHGEETPFETFDPSATIEPADGPSAADLLDQFEELRRENLETLEGLGLTAFDLDRTGVHPELGRVTLGELITTWAVHDLHHTAQICKGLANASAGNVGPWWSNIGILRH